MGIVGGKALGKEFAAESNGHSYTELSKGMAQSAPGNCIRWEKAVGRTEIYDL